MRITKVGGVYHYKNKELGELRKLEVEETKEIIESKEELIINKELGRIIKKTKDRDNEEIKQRNEGIRSLLKNALLNEKIGDSDIINLKKLYSARNYTGPKNTVGRKEVLGYALNDTVYKEHIINFIDSLAKKLPDKEKKEQFMSDVIYKVREKIDKKKIFLEKSINNNHLCKVDNRDFIYSSERANFLKSLYKKDKKWFFVEVEESRLDDIEKAFDYERFVEYYKKTSDESRYKKSKFKEINITREYIKVLGADQGFWNENKHLSLYCNEVKKYVEREANKQEKREDILEPQKMKKIVRYQFSNAIRNQLIQQGKLIHYFYKKRDGEANYQWGKNEFETADLEFIKVVETFNRKLIDAVTFARNLYVSNVLGNNETEDLGKGDMYGKIENIEKDRLEDLLRLFKLEGEGGINEGDMRKVLKDLFNAFYILRNCSYHFQDMKTKDLENDSAVESFIKRDKDFVKESLLRQYYSNGVYRYLSEKSLGEYFEKIKFEIKQGSVPFAPAFKNVISATDSDGCKRFEDIYEIKREDEHRDKYLAKKYMLQNLYDYEFVPLFVNDNSRVKKAIETFTEYVNKHEQMKGYNNILENVGFDNSINEYLSSIQKLQVDDREKEGEDKPHYKKFIQYIFRMGFHNYLVEENIDIKVEKNQPELAEEEFIGRYRDKIQVNLQDISLNKLKPVHKFFYYFIKLLDRRQINELINEFQKLEQVRNKRQVKHPIFSEDIEIYKTLMGLIKINCDSFENEPEEGYIENKLGIFFDAEDKKKFAKDVNEKCIDKRRDSLYIQSDGETSIRFHMVDKVNRNGLNELCKNLTKNKLFQISMEEIEGFLDREEGIAEKVKAKEDLHTKYIKSLARGNKSKFTREEAEDYKRLVKEIKDYDYLKQKITLGYVYKLQHLITDIFGRLVGYVSMWERDYYFMTLAHLYNKGELDKEFRNIKKLMKNGKIEKVTNLIKGNDIIDEDMKKKRNKIAHFEYFRNQERTILDYINDVRQLLSYDRKLKNSVSGSIKDILKDQWKIDVKFKMENHNLSLVGIKSEKETHLKKGREKFDVDHNHEQFVKMVEELLKFIHHAS